MLVESSSMATKFEGDDDAELELELCLSLGGPFKKTDKSKPIELCTGGQSNAVSCAKDNDVSIDGGKTRRKETRKKREAKHQQIIGEDGENKRIKEECNDVGLDLSFSKMANGYGSGQFRENGKAGAIGSPICSSSGVSDPSSYSRQEGGSCDFGVNSGQIKPVNNIGIGTEKTVHSTDGSTDATLVVETHNWSNSRAKETRKPPKPRPNGNGYGANGNLAPFAQMPCVTSTGNGPEGKTVNGFLYRYSKSEISIICVCHGTSFSPAEFIIHAGGTHVSHPLRHITVVPSSF